MMEFGTDVIWRPAHGDWEGLANILNQAFGWSYESDTLAHESLMKMMDELEERKGVEGSEIRICAASPIWVELAIQGMFLPVTSHSITQALARIDMVNSFVQCSA